MLKLAHYTNSLGVSKTYQYNILLISKGEHADEYMIRLYDKDRNCLYSSTRLVNMAIQGIEDELIVTIVTESSAILNLRLSRAHWYHPLIAIKKDICQGKQANRATANALISLVKPLANC